MSNTKNSGGRSQILDWWRCLAILLVLMHHCVLPAAAAGSIRPLVEPIARFGWTGVDLFFVLSGLLIGRLLFIEMATAQTISIGRFLIRRAFKLWPGYAVYIAYVFVFEVFIRRKMGASRVGSGLLPNVLHLQNYLGTLRVHTWSLAVEEHFYVALPPALLLCRRARPRRVLCALSSAIIFVTVARCILVAVDAGDNTYFLTHTRIDSILWGVVLAYVSVHYPALFTPPRRARQWLAASGCLLVAPMLFFDKETAFVRSIGFSMLFTGYGFLLIASSPLNQSDPPRWVRAMARLGTVSYATYLWFEDLGRTPIGILMNRSVGSAWAPELRWVTAQAAYMTLAFVAGAVTTRAVERPALRLRDRLFSSEWRRPG